MEKTVYPLLNETVYRHTLPNGLPIVVVPRPGFSKKIVYFAADYGSLYTQFHFEGADHRTPEGSAHFLEHKLFDMPGGRDVTEEFASLGASPNAFTSYDMTAYYFTCTDHFSRCLELLLDFVSTPYFTKESVDKEQGIIGQEIAMNEDNPDSKVFSNLMANMYRSHPVVNEILGSRESIAQITPETLYLIHRAFYAPSNMLLCVVGDVDPEEVVQIAQKTLPEARSPQVSFCRQWQEEMTCTKPLTRTQMEVAMPTFQLGFKCESPGQGPESIRQELIGDLAAEALFGESSPLYMELYEKGLIDTSFGGGFETIEGMAMLTASGDSDDPEAVRDAILEKARVLAKEGIPEEDFRRIRHSAIGRRIRSLDSFDATCFRVCAYHFSGYDYFQFPELYRQVSTQDIQSFIDRVVTRERCSLSIIDPQEEAL